MKYETIIFKIDKPLLQQKWNIQNREIYKAYE